MQPTAQQLHTGDFKADGTYRGSFTGYSTVERVMDAFLSIGGQRRWNPEVRDGRWERGEPEQVGSVRHLDLRGTMWTRQQITQADPNRICYVFLESGGGMPFAHGRFSVEIAAKSPEGHGQVSIAVELSYRLAGAFRLMKSVVNSATQKNLDECLTNVLDRAP